ncbi:hypothetical protein ACFHYN_06440 [Pasteurella multocida]|nr:Uncharacterised protein [Pasteurella multocida subsp. septica]
MKKTQYVKSLGVVLLGSLCWLSVNAQSQLFTSEQITKIEDKLIGKHKHPDGARIHTSALSHLN